MTSSRLAPFAYDWVGGDIHGLHALAGTLFGYVPKVTDVTTALDKQVGRVVGDAGWTGSAASAFSSAWQRDSLTGQALGVVIAGTGNIVDGLAVVLSQIENALEQEADDAARRGVQIGPDGTPGAGFTGPPSNTAEASQRQWAAAYQQVHDQAMAEAQRARQQAASELAALYQKLAPRADGMNTADATTVGGLLADLWAAPAAQRRLIDGIVEKLRGQARTVLAEAAAARAENPGKLLPKNILDESVKVRTELWSADTRLASTSQYTNKLSKLLDTRIVNVKDHFSEDLDARSADTSGADEAGDAGLLSKLSRFGGDIPVVDVLAGAVGTGLGAYHDVQSGQSWYEAVPEEAALNAGGLAAGALAGGAVAGAAVFAGAPLLAGVAGVAVGTVVAYGQPGRVGLQQGGQLAGRERPRAVHIGVQRLSEPVRFGQGFAAQPGREPADQQVRDYPQLLETLRYRGRGQHRRCHGDLHEVDGGQARRSLRPAGGFRVYPERPGEGDVPVIGGDPPRAGGPGGRAEQPQQLAHELLAGIRREQETPAPAEISQQGAPVPKQLHDSLPFVHPSPQIGRASPRGGG